MVFYAFCSLSTELNELTFEGVELHVPGVFPLLERVEVLLELLSVSAEVVNNSVVRKESCMGENRVGQVIDVD